MPLVRYSSAVVQNSPFVPVLTKSVSLFPFRLVSLDTQETYHVKVVKPGPLPQPLEHECRSTQFPARPQSEANSTVVGQKPQRLRSRSTRHSKPPLAVRSLVGSPEEKTVANLVIRGSRFWTWAGAVPDAGVGATTADSTRPARRRGRKRRGNIPCLDYLERAVKLILDEGNQTRKRRRRSRQDPERKTSPDCTARPGKTDAIVYDGLVRRRCRRTSSGRLPSMHMTRQALGALATPRALALPATGENRLKPGNKPSRRLLELHSKPLLGVSKSRRVPTRRHSA